MKKKLVSVILILTFLINIITPSFQTVNGEKSESLKYYSSLKKAIEDSNNKTTKNADSNADEGSVSVLIQDNKAIITLLKDCEEEPGLAISNNIDLNLNGKKINFITQNSSELDNDGFFVSKNKLLCVNGEVDGSEITFDTSYGKLFNMFYLDGNIDIKGGKYNLTNKDYSAWFINVSEKYIHEINVDNIELNINASLSAIGVNTSELVNNTTINFKNSKCILNADEKAATMTIGMNIVTVENNDIRVTSNKSNAYGIYNHDKSIIKNNYIYTKSNEKNSISIVVEGNSNSEIVDNEIETYGENFNSYSLYVVKNSLVNMRSNNTISTSEHGFAYGIYSSGLLQIDRTDIKTVSREIKGKGSNRYME